MDYTKNSPNSTIAGGGQLMPFINNLKNVRKARNLTQQQVSIALHIGQRAISKYEHSDRLYYDVLLKFSDFYHEPIDTLFTRINT